MRTQAGRDQFLKEQEQFRAKGFRSEYFRVRENVAAFQREQGQPLRLLMTVRRMVQGDYTGPVPYWDVGGASSCGASPSGLASCSQAPQNQTMSSVERTSASSPEARSLQT
eukprot:5235029-Alexandrium_andersonii.AAC.1